MKTEDLISSPDFWNDSERSQKVMQDRKRLEQAVEDDRLISGRVSDIETLFELGRAREAEPYAKECLALTEATLGPDHPDAVQLRRQLATAK